MTDISAWAARHLTEPGSAEAGTDVLEKRSGAAILTVASATGGCGKTFFATNVAALMATSGKRVLLMDLDLQFGEVAAALQLRSQYSVYDGLYGHNGMSLPESAFEEHLDELVVRHPLRFDVLTAPRDPALADYVGAADIERALDGVAARYDIVVVDTPPSLNEVVLTTLDRSEVIAVLAALDIPSLKNLNVFTDTLRRLKVDESKVRLVLNKIDDDIGIDVHQVQEAFGNRFVGLIPQSRSVARAMNIGRIVVDSEPRSTAAQKIREAVGAIVPDDLRPSTLPSSPKRLRGLFSRGGTE